MRPAQARTTGCLLTAPSACSGPGAPLGWRNPLPRRAPHSAPPSRCPCRRAAVRQDRQGGPGKGQIAEPAQDLRNGRPDGCTSDPDENRVVLPRAHRQSAGDPSAPVDLLLARAGHTPVLSDPRSRSRKGSRPGRTPDRASSSPGQTSQLAMTRQPTRSGARPTGEPGSWSRIAATCRQGRALRAEQVRGDVLHGLAHLPAGKRTASNTGPSLRRSYRRCLAREAPVRGRRAVALGRCGARLRGPGQR